MLELNHSVDRCNRLMLNNYSIALISTNEHLLMGELDLLATRLDNQHVVVLFTGIFRVETSVTCGLVYLNALNLARYFGFRGWLRREGIPYMDATGPTLRMVAFFSIGFGMRLGMTS